MSKTLIPRVTLIGPPAPGRSRPQKFKAPVYLVKNGLALHPAWGVDGADLIGPPLVLSAVPAGRLLARFWELEQAEAAFATVVDLCDWSKIDESGFIRRPVLRKKLKAALLPHGAVR